MQRHRYIEKDASIRESQRRFLSAGSEDQFRKTGHHTWLRASTAGDAEIATFMEKLSAGAASYQIPQAA